MKGPHAAALAAGWLAVALSMAALATAAISRVGTQSSGAQAQVTITMTATVRATSAPTAPSSAAQIPSAAAKTAGSTIDTTQTTQLGRSSTVSRTTFAPPAVIATARAASTSRPAVAVPDIGVLLPSTQTPTPAATTKKPTTSSATSKDTVEASGTASESWWKQRHGRIYADCRGDRLAYAEAWAASGYRVTKSSTWIRTAFLFDGSSPVTVLVGCHDGHATFSRSA